MPRLFLSVLPALFLLMPAACQPEAGLDTESLASPAQLELADHVVQRCQQCGWIESKLEILSSVADPHSLGIYEYTVRMADGSSRVFRETLPASWRLGERLAVIDGMGSPLN